MKLSGKERNENAIEAGLQLIPGVGGALATLYFGRKQEIRFKRLEDFYSQLSDELLKIKDKFPPIEKHDQESLLSILEKLNEEIEKESIQYKINHLKIFFKNNILSPVTEENFDNRTVFLNIISDLTVFECEVLLKINSLKENESISAFDISKATDEDNYYTGSAIHRLRNFGLIGKDSKGITYRENLDSALLDRFKVSDFGKNFIQFCMQNDN
ncbi:hypothetical protein KKHLCK_16490 [Candidatus Electrothrix laxa]